MIVNVCTLHTLYDTASTKYVVSLALACGHQLHTVCTAVTLLVHCLCL